MPYREKKIYSGNILEIERYFCTDGGRRPRRGRTQPTTEAQQRLNYLNSKKKLVRVVNCNFARGDLYITVTYKGTAPPPPEEAAKLLEKFLRRLRALRRKRGMADLKYICVTEQKGKRIHHHLLVNKMSIDEIAALWPHGRVTVSPLEPDFEYEWLARYLAKEDKPGSKRWSCSRNLKKPVEKVREINRIVLRGEPKPPKGYKLLRYDPIYSEITGIAEYSKFVKIGDDDKP